MLREWDMNEVSDGKRYQINDMVKTNCHGCHNCFACCKDMGDSIILDPYDIFSLESATQLSFEDLLAKHIQLGVVDGIILPNLKMREEDQCCTFLNDEKRCGIHLQRPGFCRMFPLGRIYEEDSFSYFLQVKECPYPDKTKVKVNQWIGQTDSNRYQQYIMDWHLLLKSLMNLVAKDNSEQMDQGQELRTINMYLLQNFFVLPFIKDGNFYDQFESRLENAKRIFSL